MKALSKSDIERDKRIFWYNFSFGLILYFGICFFSMGSFQEEIYFIPVSYIPILLAFVPYIFIGYAETVGAMWAGIVWFLIVLLIAGKFNSYLVVLYWFMSIPFLFAALFGVFILNKNIMDFRTKISDKSFKTRCLITFFYMNFLMVLQLCLFLLKIHD